MLGLQVFGLWLVQVINILALTASGAANERSRTYNMGTGAPEIKHYCLYRLVLIIITVFYYLFWSMVGRRIVLCLV